MPAPCPPPPSTPELPAGPTTPTTGIYETDTGKLFYDKDGTGHGAAVQFALLNGHPHISNADFVIA